MDDVLSFCWGNDKTYDKDILHLDSKMSSDNKKLKGYQKQHAKKLFVHTRHKTKLNKKECSKVI